jgi:hypothetical protein
MIVRGLMWFHWRVYLEDSYAVRTHTVTGHGLRLCEETLFRPNARVRVRGTVGNGAFVYEGNQGVDDPGITVWKFIVYGGLASYEDVITPETLGSHVVSMTGPLATFSRAAAIAKK